MQLQPFAEGKFCMAGVQCRKGKTIKRFYKRKFWFMVLPSIVLFLLVIIVPFIEGVIYSFTEWRGSYFVGGEHWWNALVGLKNYTSIFKSKDFLQSLGYTAIYAVLAVIAQNVVSLLLALMIKKLTKGKGLFRTVLFLPYVLGMLAMGYVWRFIFENVFSQTLFGTDGVVHVEVLNNMLQNQWKALLAYAIVGVWQVAGYYLIIYLNGLNNISEDIYEAARIDGATGWTSFRKITLPLLMPSFTIVLFMSLANSFKMLDLNVSLTEGNFGTTMISYMILKTVRESSPPAYGEAQAQAVIFFVIIAVISIAQVMITKRKEIES